MITVENYILRVRRLVDDLDTTPYLWSDEEIVDALNDALIDAATRVDLTVQDNIQIPFTQVSVGGVWNDTYALSSRVTDIKSVRLASRPYATLTRSSIRRYEAQFGGRPNASSSTPTAYFVDVTTAGKGADRGLLVRSIQFTPAPTKADTAIINVARLPAELSVDDTDAIPEIDPMWQADLIFGITGRLYLKKDTDTFDPKKSEKDLAEFERRFGVRLPASVLRERQTDVPHEMIVT